MESNERDKLWVRQCKHGDQEAFEKLMEKYAPVVYRAAARLAGTQEAEDITQEVFIQVFKSINRFEERASFSTWLYKVVHNVCSNYTRKMTYRQRHETQALEENRVGVVQQMDPEKRFFERQYREQLMTAINNLPEIHRTVIILRDFEGLSYEEIAEVAGCPVGTVRSRLHNAMKELTDKLKESFEC